MAKIQISIEEVAELIDRRKEINSIPLEDIEWTIKRVPVYVDPKVIEEFKFMGLSNVTFIEDRFYEEKPKGK